jgi:hypothetical protein
LERVKEISPDLYEASKKSLDILTSTQGSDKNQILYDDIAQQLNTKIDGARDDAGVAAKYEWTKKLVDWVKAGMAPGVFRVCEISFKSIGSW